MTTMIRFFGALLLASVLLAAVIAAAVMLWGAPLDHTSIVVNGEPLVLGPGHGVHGLAAVGGLALGLLVLLLVVPLAVVLPLLIVAVVLAVGLSVLAGVAALVFSPLILLALGVWLIWRLARRSDKPAATIR